MQYQVQPCDHCHAPMAVPCYHCTNEATIHYTASLSARWDTDDAQGHRGLPPEHTPITISAYTCNEHAEALTQALFSKVHSVGSHPITMASADHGYDNDYAAYLRAHTALHRVTQARFATSTNPR